MLIDQPFQFSTKKYDADTGLYYYGYRFYSPVIGKWLTRDPIGEDGGINLYRFVLNNPINRIDPKGLDTAGCDLIPAGWETPCRLECCAQHDKCFDDNNCTMSCFMPGIGSQECNRCNDDVKRCCRRCGNSNYDDPNRPNYYCASQHRFIQTPGDFPDEETAKRVCQSN
jgi:RHS repeat-associated protein